MRDQLLIKQEENLAFNQTGEVNLLVEQKGENENFDDDTNCPADFVFVPNTQRAKIATVLSSALLLTCSVKLVYDGVSDKDEASATLGMIGGLLGLTSLSGCFNNFQNRWTGTLSFLRTVSGGFSVVSGILMANRSNSLAWGATGLSTALAGFGVFAHGAQTGIRICAAKVVGMGQS